MANRNYETQLNGLPDKDKDTGLQLGPLKDFVMPTGNRSGKLPDRARVKLKIEDAAWRNKADNKPGKNLYLKLVSIGPDKLAGVPLFCTHPAPLTNDPSDMGFKFCASLAESVVSAAGQKALDEFRALPDASFPPPKKLIGRTVFAEVTDDRRENFKGSSQVDHYILASDYEERPGAPDHVAASAPSGDLEAAASGAASGGGAATPAKSGGVWDD